MPSTYTPCDVSLKFVDDHYEFIGEIYIAEFDDAGVLTSASVLDTNPYNKRRNGPVPIYHYRFMLSEYYGGKTFPTLAEAMQDIFDKWREDQEELVRSSREDMGRRIAETLQALV